MVHYDALFDIDDSKDFDPGDELSETVYTSCKLDYTFRSVDEVDEDDEDEVKPNLGIERDFGGILQGIERVTKKGVDGEENAEEKGEKQGETNKVSGSSWKLYRVIVGAHQGWARSCRVDPVTNRWFATGSADSTIKVWDLASLELKATITGHIMGVRALAVSTRHPYLYSGSEDKSVRCWDLEKTNSPSGCQVRNYHGHVGGIYAMDLHPELDLLFTGGRDAVVRVWDIRTRTEIMVLSGHRHDITSIASQIGDPQVISSSMDGTVRLWDLRKVTTLLTLTQHSKSIRLLTMHPNELTMCSGDSSGAIKEWVLPTGDLLNELGHSGQDRIINTMAINPRNNVLFTGYDNGKMEFYDYVDGGLIENHWSKPVPGSTESTIYDSTFDMLGSRLITCEGDKSVKIWGES